MNDLSSALNTLKGEITDILESLGRKEYIVSQGDV